MNYKYRVTKYNPNKRNSEGFYMDKEEWTDFSQFDKNSKFAYKNLNIKEYFLTENAYIYAVNKFIALNGSNDFEIKKLGNIYKNKIIYRKNTDDTLMVECVIRQVLRNKFGCKIISENLVIYFGWDYYMYIESNSKFDDTVVSFGGINIYIEKFN
jgi:hypothetical protein